MNSLVLRTAARLLISLLLVFSVFLLLRGHDEPGGGFVAGLVAAASVVLFAMAFDVPSARRFLRVDPRLLVWVGLLVAMGSGMVGLIAGGAFLQGQWWNVRILGIEVQIATPLLFDLGVFLVVVGVAVTLALSLAEE